MPKVEALHIYTDGAARGNPGPAAIAFIIEDHNGVVLKKYSESIGIATNNTAEYVAIIKALEEASKHCRWDVFCFCDSEIVVKQLNGVYKIKEKHLKEKFLEAKNKEKMFEKVTYSYLPRTHNKIKIADKLVNKELDRVNGESDFFHD